MLKLIDKNILYLFRLKYLFILTNAEAIILFRAKEAKVREYYEKMFPELKKARDDKEKISR